jgi:hypothetical protein
MHQDERTFVPRAHCFFVRDLTGVGERRPYKHWFSAAIYYVGALLADARMKSLQSVTT